MTIQVENTKVMIATPAYGEIFFSPYVKSIVELTRLLQKSNIESRFETISYAEVSESRNYLVTRFLDKTDATHLLFLDADMGFPPQLIADMLALDKPIVGVVYPKRQIDLKRVMDAAKNGDDADRAIAKGHEFILRPLPGTRQTVHKWFMQVAGCGAGILLIQRSCIESMLKKIPELIDSKTKSALTKNLSRLIRVFDPITTAESRLSEDYAFCHRWREICGGEVWANIGYPITHVGLRHFIGRFSDRVGVPVAAKRASPDSAKKIVTGRVRRLEQAPQPVTKLSKKKRR